MNSAQLWSPNFRRLALANFLLATSLYMLWPVLPTWIVQRYDVSPLCAGGLVALSGLAVYLSGPVLSYLVDTYRRRTVCLLGVLVVALTTTGYLFAQSLALVLLLRLLQGAMAGLYAMASGGTLVIDLSQSPYRTAANLVYAWFARIGLAVGPFVGLLLQEFFPLQTILLVSAGLAAVAVVLLFLLHIPFRAPLAPPLFSLDRFLLSNGWLMFVNLLLIAVPTGILLGMIRSYTFFGVLAVGFLLAILALKFVFTDADIRSEVVSGLILYGCAMLLQISHHEEMAFYTSAIFVGLGLGLILPKLQFFFIELSEHCERGSANNMYYLGWELGLALGFFIGFGCIENTWMKSTTYGYLTVLMLLIVALGLYLLLVHPWFMKHKRR